MRALYYIYYEGHLGNGYGALYVGDGVVAGFDAIGGRYSGTCSDEGAMLAINVTLSIPQGGWLVTGKEIGPGEPLQIVAYIPNDQSNAPHRHTIMVDQKFVTLVIQKMVDVPATTASSGRSD